MSRPVPTLLILSLLTFFLGLGRPAITDSDEAFYAEASREMVELGDWLTPHFNYENRWQKPVLYYWLTAATYLLTGPTEFAARLWSALSGLGIVFITWATARRMARDTDSAWLAGAIVATCFGCFAMARSALPDLPLAFFTTACIAAALRASERNEQVWWILAGIAGGLGFLTKGPVALVIPALVLLPIWWRERRTLVVSWRGIAIAIVAAAIVGLPWYLAMAREHGQAYLQSFFVGDNLERFTTGRFNERRPLWFYVPVVLGGTLPWSVYLVALPGASLWEVLRRRRQLSQNEWRLLIWVALPLILFALSVGQQPRYILPLLPPLSIGLAQSFTRRVNDARYGDGTTSLLLTATCLTAALLIAVTIVLVRVRPLFIAGVSAIAALGSVVLAVCAFLLIWDAVRRKWQFLGRVMIVAAVTLLLTVQFGAMAGVRPEPVEQVADLVRSSRTGTELLGQYRVFSRNLPFYTRMKQVELYDDEQVLNFMRSSERVFLVLANDDLIRLQSAAGTAWNTLGRFEYLNAANVRVGDVLWPDPAKSLTTVVVASNR